MNLLMMPNYLTKNLNLKFYFLILANKPSDQSKTPLVNSKMTDIRIKISLLLDKRNKTLKLKII